MIQTIAIGTLALLALSSVMSPKAFRMLLATLGIGSVLAITMSIGVLGNSRPLDPHELGGLARYLSPLQRQWGGQSNWNVEAIQAARERAQQELQQTTPPTRGGLSIYRAPIDVPDFSRATGQKVLAEVILAVNRFLQEESKKPGAHPGLKILQAKDVDISRIGFVIQKRPEGQRWFVGINEEFKQHIQLRARQVIMRERLRYSVYTCFAIAAVLCALYGLLKVFNTRRGRRLPEQDFLRLSGISLR